jgi:hypothetical protein
MSKISTRELNENGMEDSGRSKGIMEDSLEEASGASLWRTERRSEALQRCLTWLSSTCSERSDG